MIKFFRKYNKRILAIIVVGLMIVFLGGDALQFMLTPNPSAIVIGEAFGRPITQADYATVENQIKILRNLRIWGQVMPPVEELDYLLLVREGQHEGLSPSVERARAQLAERDLTRFSLDYKVSTDQIEFAMANYLLVAQMWSAAQQSILTSELEIRQAIRDQYEKVTANVLEIKSPPLINPDETVPEEVIREHFQKYRDQTPSGDPLNFGYLVPDRVQLEYLKISSDQITPDQPITAKQAETYWRNNKEQFKRPAESLLLEALDKPSSPFYGTFAEAREDVIRYLTQQAQLEEARIMASVLESVLREPWHNLTIGASGFPPAPEAVQRPDYYHKLLETLRDRLKQADAITIDRTELFAAADAAKQPAIGVAREDTQSASKGQPFGKSTHHVEGLVDAPRLEAAARSSILALYQTAPVLLIDDHNDLYLYRVIKVEKQHPPASIDEVRERVVADVRALNAFNLAKSHAEQIHTHVSADGLKAAWEAYDGLPLEKKAECGAYWETNPFARVFELVPGIRFPVTVSDKAGESKHEIRSDELVNQVYDMLESGGVGATGQIPLPNLEKCLVVQIADVQHLTPSDYETRKQSMKEQVGRDRAMALTRDWFSSEGLRTRTEYKPVQTGS